MALALNSRRSTIAAVASALAAMALAAMVAGRSCQVTQPGPEAAVHDLIQAVKAGERGVVFELLTPATRGRLEAEAKRATYLVGASQRYSAADLISIGSSDGVADPTEISLIDETGDRAVVEVVSSGGRARVELLRLEGRWLIDLPHYGTLP